MLLLMYDKNFEFIATILVMTKKQKNQFSENEVHA